MVEKVRGADEIVSIGGGSTIDTGKYIAWKLDIPHTAKPTTAGTGSEVTKYAVFTKNGKKFSFENKELIPNYSVLNPSLVVTLPPLHTASSGLDALSQCVESSWSLDSTKESLAYAKEGIKLVLSNLLDSYNNPKNEMLRMEMLIAANNSGKAINITRTSICHAISYPLTIDYGIPHGIACAMTLPYFMRYFGIKGAERVQRLFNYFKFDIPKFDIDDVAEKAMESSRSKNTPKKVTKKNVKESLYPYVR